MSENNGVMNDIPSSKRYHIKGKNFVNVHKPSTPEDNAKMVASLNEEIKKKLADIKKHSIHNGYTGDTTYKFNRVNKTYKDYL